MSDQMTKDWIEQEYDRWKKYLIHNSREAEELKRSQYIAKNFAFHMLKKSASFKSNKSEVPKG